MELNPQTTLSFTGHRTYRQEADEALRRSLRRHYEAGIRICLSGMAEGFDLAAAEVVLSLREEFPDLRLCCVVPFRGHRVPLPYRERYDRVLATADEVIVLSEGYHPRVFRERNNYLTDHAHYLIAWFDGSKSGTHYTIHRALRRGLTIENLYPEKPID